MSTKLDRVELKSRQMYMIFLQGDALKVDSQQATKLSSMILGRQRSKRNSAAGQLSADALVAEKESLLAAITAWSRPHSGP